MQNRITASLAYRAMRFPARVRQRNAHHTRPYVRSQVNARLPPDSSRALLGKFHWVACGRNLDVHHVRTHGSLEGLRPTARERASARRKNRKPHLECLRGSALSRRRRCGAFSYPHNPRRFLSGELGAGNLPAFAIFLCKNCARKWLPRCARKRECKNETSDRMPHNSAVFCGNDFHACGASLQLRFHSSAIRRMPTAKQLEPVG